MVREFSGRAARSQLKERRAARRDVRVSGAGKLPVDLIPRAAVSVKGEDVRSRSSPERGHLADGYRTDLGRMYLARIEDALAAAEIKKLQGKVNLIVTSPPFPLVRKKEYGNENGAAYLEWLCSLAAPLTKLLAKDGSIVIEIGNAWEPGVPEMSTLPLEALLAFKRAAGLHLCQHAG